MLTSPPEESTITTDASPDPVEADEHHPIVIEICARPPHTAFLVVEYNGRQPPTALFADLAMIGWSPPAMAPPPKSAIDWSTPNERNGESFTVSDYIVEGAIVEPPSGRGPRGSWLPAERTALLTPLDGVLRRHQVTVVNRLEAMQSPSSGRTSLRDKARRMSLRPGTPAPLPTTAETTPATTTAADPIVDDDDLDLVKRSQPCIHLVVELALVEVVAAEIEASRMRHWRTSDATLAGVGTFRGSQHVTQRRAVEFEIWVPATHVDDLVDGFAGYARVDPSDVDRCWVTVPRACAIHLDPLPAADAEVPDPSETTPADVTTGHARPDRTEMATRPFVTSPSDSGDPTLTRPEPACSQAP